MRKFFFLLLLLTVFLPSYSIDTHWDLEPQIIKNGVGNNTIYHVCYGSEGFMWFSTDKGISISTHYITEDYEIKYAPLFQACVLNFVNEIQRFHDVDITEHIAQNFLTISARYEPLSNEEIRLKYSPEIAEKLIKQANEIDVLSNTHN